MYGFRQQLQKATAHLGIGNRQKIFPIVSCISLVPNLLYATVYNPVSILAGFRQA